MGRDKAALPVDGRPMIDRAVSALDPHCDEVIVVSGRADTPTGPWRIVPDRRASCGPLGGIETALAEADSGGHEAVVVLAVDLPLVDAAGIGTLLSAGGGFRAAAAARPGDPPFEPLCAVYPTGALETARGLLDSGERAARALLTALGGDIVEDVPGASVNVNAPADVGRAEEKLA
jgi:molybdopterin-guanine dinucleotide biosynthesis protein A